MPAHAPQSSGHEFAVDPFFQFMTPESYAFSSGHEMRMQQRMGWTRRFLVIVRAAPQEMDGILHGELEYKCQTNVVLRRVHT